jgi:hypothetical protein
VSAYGIKHTGLTSRTSTLLNNQIKNIHTWTSAFINFMGIMLEKWPGKAKVYLKYMHVIRLAASMVSSLGSFWSHSVKKGLSGADTHSNHSSTSTSAHDDCGALAFRRRNCSSYETHPKFDTLEAANLITCIYLRYTCALESGSYKKQPRAIIQLIFNNVQPRCVHISLNLSITTSFQKFYYRHHDFITLRSMWVTDDHGHVPFVAIHNHRR